MSAKQNYMMAGVCFALLNAFMLGAMSLFAKWLASYMGPVEVTFYRNLVSFLFLGVFLAIFIRRFDVWRTNRPWAHLLRSSIGLVGITLGAWALSMMPLAETTLLLFTSPLFTVILSALFLKERVGPMRIGAVFLGFSGVIFIAYPFGGNFAEALPLLGIAVGLGWGFASGAVDACLRWLGSTESSETTVFYFLIFGIMITGLYSPNFAVAPIAFLDDASLLWMVLGLGITGVGSLLSKTQSYRLAEASVIAPIMYTMLLWSALFDYIFWDRIPGWNLWLGAAIIIAANLFIIHRERRFKAG